MLKFRMMMRKLESWMVTIAAISLFSIMLVVVLDVVLRYAFNSPLSWSYELISMYLMAIVFFFALSDTLEHDSHISVDILHAKMSVRARHGCMAISYWLSLVVFIFILLPSIGQTWISFKDNEVTAGIIQWPVWLSWLSVPIGVGFLLIRIFLRAVGHTLSVVQDKPLIELPKVAGIEKE